MMVELPQNPIFWVVISALSEIIGMSKLKDNSVIELIFHLLMRLKPRR